MPDSNNSQFHKRSDCLSPIVFILSALWVIIVVVSKNALHFFIPAVITITPSWVFFIFSFAQAILLIIPFLTLGLTWRNLNYRTIYRLWTVGAIFGLLYSPLQLLPVSSAQLHAFLHCLVSVALILLTIRFSKKGQFIDHNKTILSNINPNLLLASIAISALIYIPWLIIGSLGSIVDSLLQLLTGISLSLAWILIQQRITSKIIDTESHPNIKQVIFNAFSTSFGITIFASGLGFPYGALQMLIILSLPGLSWLITAFHIHARITFSSSFLPSWILLGSAITAPMLLIDPDELNILFNATRGEILSYGIISSIIILGFEWLMGLISILIIFFRFRSSIQETYSRHTSPTLILLVITSCALGLIFYYSYGQPGFYGEDLLVILKDQADITHATHIEDPISRRVYVYHTLVSHAQQSQADIRNDLDYFGVDYTPYYLINAIRVDDRPLLRLWLLTRPEVKQVLANPILRPLPGQISQFTGMSEKGNGIPWNISLTGADRVWNELGITGEGIIVGQSDSGVQFDHPELVDSYRGKSGNHDYSWLDPWYDTLQPYDYNGHGTHTLGIIVGSHTGMAPGASWFGCANLVRPLGNPGYYLECMQFMLAPYPHDADPFTAGNPKLGAHIINNSWGCPPIEGCDPDTLLTAVNNLRSAGVFTVAAAGNDGPFCASLIYPIATYDAAFTVGAIDANGQLTFFSSIGPSNVAGVQNTKPDIAAPGEDILSATPGDSYAVFSGTSMASPHVAGAVALMWSANPQLIGNIDLTEHIIISTAHPYQGRLPDCPGASNYPSNAVGYGIINAYDAVRSALTFQSP